MIEIWAESTRFYTSQRFVDQTRMILKESCFFDLKIPQICRQINREEYQQDSLTQIETLNTEKQERCNSIAKENSDDQNSTDPNTTK